jgi:ABC-type cobalamin/Fe3+-siderophores transport system ATPase subunit
VTTVGGRTLLDRCSVSFPPGQLCAVLGPSGSGKSVLLNVLRGRPPGEVGDGMGLGGCSMEVEGGMFCLGGRVTAVDTRAECCMRRPLSPCPSQVSGSLTVNGLPLSDGHTLAALRPLLGFVAKEDIVDRAMTAREQLLLSAQQHLPAGTPAAAVNDVVRSAMATLKLRGVADVIVGGSANAAANISGGQLKRVSVGVELVSQPRAIILDGAACARAFWRYKLTPAFLSSALPCSEPTSGLDATSSLELMQVRRRRQRGFFSSPLGCALVYSQCIRWLLAGCKGHCISRSDSRDCAAPTTA